MSKTILAAAPRTQSRRDHPAHHAAERIDRTDREFLKASHRQPGAYEGRRFNDTDVYKLVEAASDSLLTNPDPALDKQLDDMIAIIAAAQEQDGYLFPRAPSTPRNRRQVSARNVGSSKMAATSFTTPATSMKPPSLTFLLPQAYAARCGGEETRTWSAKILDRMRVAPPPAMKRSNWRWSSCIVRRASQAIKI